MRIGTNVMSLKTQNFLRNTNDKLQVAMERLSSGQRINSAKDDAAGLAISSRMEGQIRGMDTAARNALDGVSLLETAESTLGSTNNILQRMRELAVQADNGTYSADDINSLENEFTQLIDEIENIANTASFNGITLLDGTVNVVQLHTGYGATAVMSVSLVDLLTIHGDLSSETLVGTGSAQSAIIAIDKAIDDVTAGRAILGSSMNRLSFTIDNLMTSSSNLSAARSRIADADMAREVSEMTKQQILLQSSTSMLVQANQNPQAVLQLLQ